MCRRFMALGVDVIGTAIEADFKAGGRSVGLIPGGMPAGTTSAASVWPPASQWHAAPTAVTPAALQVESPMQGRDVSVVTPAIMAI